MRPKANRGDVSLHVGRKGARRQRTDDVQSSVESERSGGGHGLDHGGEGHGEDGCPEETSGKKRDEC